MRNLIAGDDQRNALAAGLATILGDAIVLVVQRPDVNAALRGIVAPVKTAEPEPTGLLSRRALAKHLSRSVATVDRLVLEGLPHSFVGDSKRFDLQDCLDWLAARGKRATKAKPSKADVDVSDVAESAGLRAADETR
jgi:hypothetical protein